MNILKENRLIGYNLSTYQKMVTSGAGVKSTAALATPKPVTIAPTRPSRRTPETAIPGQATPIPQQYREDARLEEIASYSGPGSIKTKAELDTLISEGNKTRGQAQFEFDKTKKDLEASMKLGLITSDEFIAQLAEQEKARDAAGQGSLTQEQYVAALAQLEGGAVGVNPFGFGGEGARRDADGNLIPLQVGSPNQGITERATAGAPLVSPQAGAMGRAGAQGIKPKASQEAGDKAYNDVLKRYEDLARQGSTINRAGVEKEAEDARQNAISSKIAEQNALMWLQDKKKEERQQAQEQVHIQTPMQSIPEIDFSIANLKGLTAESMGVRKDVFNAFLPALNLQISQLQSKRSEAEKIDTYAERLSLAEEMIAPAKELAARREAQFEQRRMEDQRLLKESRDIMVEAYKISADINDIDKKIFEEEVKQNEVKQMALNLEGEKRLRRSLNALGIQGSPLAVEYLQGKITEAADALSSMIRTNNLGSLRYSAARDSLNNGLRSTLNEYEGKVAIINSNFDDNIFKLDEFIDGARSDALEGLKTDWQKLEKDKDDLMTEAADRIEKLTLKSLEMNEAHTTGQNAIKKASLEHLINVFKNFEPGSSMRQNALTNAEKEGVDITGIDINDKVVSTSANEAAVSAELHSLLPYMDNEKELDLMTAANAVAGNAVRTQVDNQYLKFKQLVDAGKYEEAVSAMKKFANSKMPASMKNNNSSRNVVVIKTAELLSLLDRIEDTGQAEDFFNAFGKAGEEMQKRADKVEGYKNLKVGDLNWYTREIQNVKNKFGKSKDPELQDLYARVESLAAFTIHELYGAAVTEPELVRARMFIAMSGDTLEDMKIKLKRWGDMSAEANRSEMASMGLDLPMFVKGLDTDLPIYESDEPAATDDELDQMMLDIENDKESMGEVSYSGRNNMVKQFDGRRVELAAPVMMAFNSANEAFKADYGMDIRVGEEISATKRDQAKTIQTMARRAGIEFNEANPNETARKLRDMGRQVANVGSSKHEIGEAVDLYPFDIAIGNRNYTGHEYIALVKPYLEKYGIMQRNWEGRDPGNFEFSITL